MERTATQVIRLLEARVARLEKQSGSEYVREYLRQNPGMSQEEKVEFMLEQGMNIDPTPSNIKLTIEFIARNKRGFVKSVKDLGLPLTNSPKYKSGGDLVLHFTFFDFVKFWRHWQRMSTSIIQKYGVSIDQIYIIDGTSSIRGEKNISSHVNKHTKRGSSRIDVVKINDLLIQDRSLQNISGFERDWMDKELGPYWSKDGGDTLVQPQYTGSKVKISIFNAFDTDNMRDLTRPVDLRGKSPLEAAGDISDMIMSALKNASRRASKKAAMNFGVSKKEVVEEAIREGLEIREDWTDRDGVRLVAERSTSPSLTLLVSDKGVTLQSVDPRTGMFDSLNSLPLQTGIALSRMVSLMIKQSR